MLFPKSHTTLSSSCVALDLPEFHQPLSPHSSLTQTLLMASPQPLFLPGISQYPGINQYPGITLLSLPVTVENPNMLLEAP